MIRLGLALFAGGVASVALWVGRAEAAPFVEFGCPNCLLAIPEGESANKRPLVVALHGDNASVYHRKFAVALAPAAERAGAVLFAPRCPVAKGCTSASYWQWLVENSHDEKWLAARIAAVAERTPIDPRRVYAAGYSGGATYLGWYAPKHPEAFAAVAHLAGGKNYPVPCPATKYPVFFILGEKDPMIVPFTAPLRRYYDGCGFPEVVWQTRPGISHEGMLDALAKGVADEVMAWLLTHPPADAPAPATKTEATSTPSAVASAEPVALRLPQAAPAHPPASGCGCRVAQQDSPSGLAALALGLIAVLARRRRP